ncbi:hypothetical protein [Haloferax sp. YSSS75]|uniref:DUF7857 domain-containing protein n=1 Tax=Haloferax sp. YSSS75 TaxID=3388564 RepID=UPI00398CA450
MHSDVDVTVAADVALVSVTLDNTDPVAQRVRVRNRLGGPVLPPRRAGVPEPGWDDEGFEGVVPAESTIALGYACPTDDASELPSDVHDDDAVELDVLGRDADSDATPASPTDAIRQLGPARPPADAVPAVDSVGDVRPTDATPERRDVGRTAELVRQSEARTDEAETDTKLPDADRSPDTRDSVAPPSEPTDEAVAMAISATDGPTDEVADTPTDESVSTPPSGSAHSSFLAACERRIELAERLDGASVRTAAVALEDADATVESLESLAADRERLRRIAARATELADRAADADPNVDALRGLA